MANDHTKKSVRNFQCRDYLYELFEEMSQDLDCSVDYLINEAMRQYAKSRNYGGKSIPGRASIPPTASAADAPMRESFIPENSSALIAATPSVPAAVVAPAPAPASIPAPAPAPLVRPASAPAEARPTPVNAHAAASLLDGADLTPPPAALPPLPAASPIATLSEPAPRFGLPPMNAALPPLGSPMAAPALPPLPPALPPMAPLPPMSAGLPPLPPALPSGPPALPPAPAPAPPVASRPALFVIFNGQKMPVTLNNEEFIIGRSSKTADLAIKDGNISRRHAAVIFHGGAYYMKDLGSTNGVDFQGQKVGTKRIDEGDVFTVCEYEVRFTYH